MRENLQVQGLLFLFYIQLIKIKRGDRTISYVPKGLAPEVNLVSSSAIRIN
jgi:hypothetical protein